MSAAKIGEGRADSHLQFRAPFDRACTALDLMQIDAPGDGLLLAFESLRRRQPTRGDGEGDSDPRIAKLSIRQAAAIGTAQAAALIPGISRSGITMGGGLIAGLSNEDAARFAFLLATPIIGAAGVLTVAALAALAVGELPSPRPRTPVPRRPPR
jgi:undecaprenyl pyrophosphate phosphatase UppP